MSDWMLVFLLSAVPGVALSFVTVGGGIAWSISIVGAFLVYTIGHKE